ncbi:MAG: hypothetical protein M1383_05155 [Patescibacteria group bacterium]|nr:hypothetical protein [Patescibacteria group bacterium]
MCYEQMRWSKQDQLALLKGRKKALKERLEKVDRLIQELEREKAMA